MNFARTAIGELPRSMKAHLLEEFNQPYALRDVPVPTIDDPNDLLIHVDAASYCHTDAVLGSGVMRPPPLPHVGCHEFAGTIVALGDASIQQFKIGDRVAVPGRGNHVCGKCIECQNPSGLDPDEPGYSVYCPYAAGSLGVAQAGGFREYALVDSRQVALIPSSMSAVEIAPLMCAGLTIYAALRKCELQPGQRVGIMGCGGGLGHLGLQFATKMGLKTTGVDISPQALDLARNLVSIPNGAAVEWSIGIFVSSPDLFIFYSYQLRVCTPLKQSLRGPELRLSTPQRRVPRSSNSK